jgi:hypothetical protein
MSTLTKPESLASMPAETSPHDAELLFREAKLRERRRRLKWIGLTLTAVALASVILGATFNAFGSSPSSPSAVSPALAKGGVARMLTCRGSSVVKPTSFVITCADGNTELTSTHWTSWSATGATGTTTFGINLCKPYCAASPMTFLPKSRVRLSAPEVTKNGKFFSSLVVNYTLHGKATTYRFSWRGDPSF